jgi:hypothetical protein
MANNYSEKTDMVLVFRECQQNSHNAAALYAERYPERYHPPHNYFLRIVNNLREKGELPDDDNWCGLLCGKLLGPYFYDSTLTCRRYQDFLSNTLPTFLDEFNLDTRMNLFFQQDGAPVHNAIIVRE